METQNLNHLLKVSASSGRAKNQTHTLKSSALESPSHKDTWEGKVKHLAQHQAPCNWAGMGCALLSRNPKVCQAFHSS